MGGSSTTGASSHARADEEFLFVLRTPEGWQLTPVPVVDPVPIDADGVIELMRSGRGRHRASDTRPDGVALPSVGEFDIVRPVWMFTGLVAGGRFVVGAPTGGEVVLDESDVRLLDAMADGPSPAALVAAGHGDLAEVCRRLARIVAAGCATIGPARSGRDEGGVEVSIAGASPAPDGAPPQSSGGTAPWRVRMAEAYRLSSKLRPLRAVGERWRRGPG